MEKNLKEIYIIKIIHANITRITEAKQDPYCKIELENQKFQTKVQEDTPTKPIWEETFTLNKPTKTLLKTSVWDWDSPKKSDLIGEGEYDLKVIKFGEKKSVSVDIFYKAKKAGVVLMEIEFTNEKPIEIPKKEKKVAQKKLMNAECSKYLETDFNTFLLKSSSLDLDQFLLESKVRQALMGGLIALGKEKPANPIKFIGDFLMKYKEWFLLLIFYKLVYTFGCCYFIFIWTD